MTCATLLAAATASAAPPTTTTFCTPTDEKLKYACEVVLMVDGEPLQGATVNQHATMPSMPLAHNIPPTAPAEDPDRPGHYAFQVKLDMHGEWMFTYNLKLPVRDRVHEKILFLDGNGSTSTDHSGHSHNQP